MMMMMRITTNDDDDAANIYPIAWIGSVNGSLLECELFVVKNDRCRWNRCDVGRDRELSQSSSVGDCVLIPDELGWGNYFPSSVETKRTGLYDSMILDYVRIK